VGAFEYVPYLLKWLESHPLKAPLCILSNAHEQRSRSWGRALAEALKVPLHCTATHLNGHAIFPWSEQRQHELLREAKAAIDIKGGPWLGYSCWPQQTKPPTKGQKYVTSGVPFAVNADSHTHDYFQKRGFDLAVPENEARWFSHEYWEETARFAASYRASLTLEAIGLGVKNLVESVA
jgi:hypothetical protein